MTLPVGSRSRLRPLFFVALLTLTLGALLLRLPDLGNRPFHGDEAVHAVKFRDLWEKGVYRYDANEFHGPTIYYAALPAMWLRGRHDFVATQEADYRLPIVLFGAALLLWLIPLADGLGRQSALWAATLIALSPAFVFYSRYYIQEMLLAFFTLGALACGWRYARSHRIGWLLGAAVCAGLMIASKETAVLTFVTIALSIWLTTLWTRRADGLTIALWPLWNPRIAILALSLAILTACLFLTGFGTNWNGPVDYLRSYTPWLTRAQGTDLHRHPWYYYLQILLWTHPPHRPIWSEGLIVGLAAVGFVAALHPRQKRPANLDTDLETNSNAESGQITGGKETDSTGQKTSVEGSISLARFIAFYTLTLTVLYSVIPYKTPWCVLSFLEGMILLAGMGAAALLNRLPGWPLRTVAALLLLIGCAQLGFQAYSASYVYEVDDTNPYVYAQPVPEAAKLGSRVEELALSSTQHDNMVVKVISVDGYYWPLPWYLRRFPNVGYYTGQVPTDPNAPIVLASPQFDDELTQKLESTHLMTGYFGLRPGAFFEVWVRLDLWKAHLENRKKHLPPPDSDKE